MRIVRRLFLLAVFVGIMVLGWSFASRNADPVAVDYFIGEFPGVPLWTVILASFGSGAILAGFFSLFELTKQGLVARRYRKTAEGLESEIHQMRNLPLVAGDESPVASDRQPGAAVENERGV